MRLGVVIGSIWSTRKEERFIGMKLLIVKPLDPTDESAKQTPYIAADAVGAGVGDMVIVVHGSSARVAAGGESPVDAAIVAIVDDKELDARYL